MLDALQNLVVQGRAAQGSLSLSGRDEAFQKLRVALDAAENVIATPRGARLDHLKRVEARGPGPRLVKLGPYDVELVHHELLDPPERIRIWRNGHILAEVELQNQP